MSTKVKDLMTTPAVSVKKETTLREIAMLIAEHSFSGVPVVDEEDRVVGVISEADVLQYTQQIIVNPLRNPFSWLTSDKEVVNVNIPQRGVELVELIAKTTADKVMTREVITVQENDPTTEVAKKMASHEINRLPVVDKDGKLVGIVTRADLIRNLAKQMTTQPENQ